MIRVSVSQADAWISRKTAFQTCLRACWKAVFADKRFFWPETDAVPYFCSKKNE